MRATNRTRYRWYWASASSPLCRNISLACLLHLLVHAVVLLLLQRWTFPLLPMVLPLVPVCFLQATRGTSSILFSRGDGCAWLFDCGGGPSPTHAASACRRAASAADAAAAEAGAVGDLSSRLERAVAAAVAAEAITWTNPAVAATQQQQQQQETRKVRILHPGFPSPFAVPRLRWWDTRVLKSAAGVASLCLALSAETHGRGPAGICDASSRGPLPRPPFLSVPNSARSRGVRH